MFLNWSEFISVEMRRGARESNFLMEARRTGKGSIGAKHMEGACMEAELTRTRGSASGTLRGLPRVMVRGRLH